jgi:hypothetical protein
VATSEEACYGGDDAIVTRGCVIVKVIKQLASSLLFSCF